MKFTPDEKKLFVLISRQYPEIQAALQRVRIEELEFLARAMNPESNLGVLQGRIQALTELQRVLQGHVE